MGDLNAGEMINYLDSLDNEIKKLRLASKRFSNAYDQLKETEAAMPTISPNLAQAVLAVARLEFLEAQRELKVLLGENMIDAKFDKQQEGQG